ncbi:hypothetical protein GHK86_08485 [Acidimicrobiaceae bacterium USS-CC1]|uniref:ABC transporter permease n=1 Tax=Acidiferrimicrobium australe TaxID=2664430 RepID=A0ABW9QTX2_9ACTN|nr:hypothetical protein [Acidiferrimicrobium australe]
MSTERHTSLISTARAFVRMGCQATLSYPMSLVLSQLGNGVAVVSLFFLTRIVRDGPDVGHNYLTFVVLGMVGQNLVMSAIFGIGTEMDAAIQQGRLEMLLIEPIRWPIIPAGLALWPMILSLWSSALTIGVGLALGVHLSLLGVVEAIPLAVVASVSGLAIGILAATVRILAKRSDPVFLIYSVLSGLVAGISVPINVLPAPLRALAWALPTMYVSTGLRKLLMANPAGVYGPGALWATLALAAAAVPLAALAIVLFNRSVNVGRKLGVLAGY